MIDVKQVIFKKRTVQAEFCTVCQEFLTGNGSIMYPWKCGCGEYTFEWGSTGWKHPKDNSVEGNQS